MTKFEASVFGGAGLLLALTCTSCATHELVVEQPAVAQQALMMPEQINPAALKNCPSRNWKQCREHPEPMKRIPLRGPTAAQ